MGLLIKLHILVLFKYYTVLSWTLGNARCVLLYNIVNSYPVMLGYTNVPADR